MADSFTTNCLYFDRPGPKNTEELLAFAARRAADLGIKKVLVASSSGRTARLALEHFDPGAFEVIVVSHVTGHHEPNQQALSPQTRQELEAKGAKVITAAHAFGGVGRGLRKKLGTFQVDEIMAHTLRMLGQGVKVGVEMSYMAADRGYVRTDEDVLTIAGTAKGADTALVVKPANSADCLDLKVREVVAKPWRP